jgi:hypothetical protein
VVPSPPGEADHAAAAAVGGRCWRVGAPGRGGVREVSVILILVRHGETVKQLRQLARCKTPTGRARSAVVAYNLYVASGRPSRGHHSDAERETRGGREDAAGSTQESRVYNTGAAALQKSSHGDVIDSPCAFGRVYAICVLINGGPDGSFQSNRGRRSRNSMR